jgi:hypothetical protein
LFPLDVPVNLATRQLKSPAFQINLRETYFVALWSMIAATSGMTMAAAMSALFSAHNGVFAGSAQRPTNRADCGTAQEN